MPPWLGLSWLLSCHHACHHAAPGEPTGSPVEALPGADPVPARVAQQLAEAARAAGAADQPYTNRLILESSPYLRQHAHNPVDWYPWGAEAFARARALDRPILLSVGYSTCHWCHVMAHESFEDPEIAALINGAFVPVKVDREERPDVDEVYMAAVHALNRGRGGWPMTLVLTPDGDPVFAATYLPARDGDRGARRGLQYVLTRLADDWQHQRPQLLAHASEITTHLVQLAAPAPPGDVPPPAAITAAIDRFMAQHDREHGGFGQAPKFPRPAVLDLLLLSEREAPRHAAVSTLLAMSRGGICDQLGGGFHRYATDARWRVPHFEKMLYDNAQLVSTATAAWQATGDDVLAGIVAETADYLLRELRLPSGAFASATDADSPAPGGHLEEGRFFTWTPSELDALLEPSAASLIRELYGVTDEGDLDGRSVLYQARPPSPGEQPLLAQARRTLLDARSTRTAPQRDDKIIVAWNGYTISALARASIAFAEPSWASAAIEAADALLEGAVGEDGRLRRLAGPGDGPAAVLEDEASLAVAFLDLFEATGDPVWIDRAGARLQIVQRHFAAPQGGWFRTPDDGEALLVRSAPDRDGAEPSGTALALSAMLRLGHLTLDERWTTLADRGLAAHAQQLRERGPSAPAILGALAKRHAPARELVIVWPPGTDPAPLLDVVRSRWLPHTARITAEQGALEAIAAHVPWVRGKLPLGDSPTAYVCEGGVCQRPTTDPQVLASSL